VRAPWVSLVNQELLILAYLHREEAQHHLSATGPMNPLQGKKDGLILSIAYAGLIRLPTFVNTQPDFLSVFGDTLTKSIMAAGLSSFEKPRGHFFGPVIPSLLRVLLRFPFS
jgi:hypothetical protein